MKNVGEESIIVDPFNDLFYGLCAGHLSLYTIPDGCAHLLQCVCTRF